MLLAIHVPRTEPFPSLWVSATWDPPDSVPLSPREERYGPEAGLGRRPERMLGYERPRREAYPVLFREAAAVINVIVRETSVRQPCPGLANIPSGAELGFSVCLDCVDLARWGSFDTMNILHICSATLRPL